MKLTRNGKIATGVASAVAGTVLVGSLIVAPSAGADVLPEDQLAQPDSSTAFPSADQSSKDWATSVDGAIAALNQGKKNEDGLLVKTGQENVTVSDGTESQTGQGRVDFAEEFPEAIAEDGSVTVLVMPVRNISNPDNAPVVIQPFGNAVDGFNFRALNKDMEGIDGDTVRLTYVAYATVNPESV